MTTFLPWSEDMVTGIAIVDQQHHGLVDLLNEIASLLAHAGENPLQDIQPVLDRLLAYTATHFQTEENLMAEYRVDARVVAHHHNTHAELVDTVVDMVKRFQHGNGITGTELLSFLAGWLVFHTIGEDQTMARQITAIRAGATPAQAYMHAEGARLAPTPEVLSRTMVACYTVISEHNRKLAQYGNHLEELVRERTAELEALTVDLRRSRDAAEAGSRAKSRFLGMMSHELRTPMNAVLGFAQALRGEGLPPRQDTLARKIVDASGHLLELLNGILQYARIDPQEQAPPARDADLPSFALARLLAEASREAFAAARGKGIQTRLEIDPRLPAHLRGDARHIADILKEFASNAAKFTERGTILLRARCQKEDAEGRYQVRFSVADTGIGIPPEHQEGLFDAFTQIDDSPTRKYGGIGLGLTLARQFAHRIGGEVGMHSEPGKGSQFWLEIRLARGAEEAREAGAAPAAGTETAAAAPGGADETTETTVNAAFLARLDRLLSQDDTQAGELVESAAAGLRRLFGGGYDDLARQIADYEFEQALATLRALIRHLPKK